MRPSPEAAARAAVAAAYGVGAAVEADYGLEGNWYPGTIAAVLDDGSFDVAYDDGEAESRVPRSAVRALAAAAPAAGVGVDDGVDGVDDDAALPLPVHDLYGALAEAHEKAGHGDAARTLYEKAAALAAGARDGRARARTGTFLTRAAAL